MSEPKIEYDLHSPDEMEEIVDTFSRLKPEASLTAVLTRLPSAMVWSFFLQTLRAISGGDYQLAAQIQNSPLAGPILMIFKKNIPKNHRN